MSLINTFLLIMIWKCNNFNLWDHIQNKMILIVDHTNLHQNLGMSYSLFLNMFVYLLFSHFWTKLNVKPIHGILSKKNKRELFGNDPVTNEYLFERIYFSNTSEKVSFHNQSKCLLIQLTCLNSNPLLPEEWAKGWHRQPICKCSKNHIFRTISFYSYVD